MGSRMPWDSKVAKKFITSIIRLEDVASWFDRTYGWAYDNYVNNKTRGRWLEKWNSLDVSELEKINEMIDTQSFTYRGDNQVIAIRKYTYDNKQHSAKYVIVVRKDNIVTCITDDMPEDIYKWLSVAWPWDMDLDHFALKTKMNTITLFGQRLVCPDYDTYWRIKRISQSRARDYQRAYGYLKCARDLGFDGYLQANSWSTLQEYMEKIKLFVDENNRVYLPTSEPLHSNMSSFATRRGGSLNQLLKDLGYDRKYKPDDPCQDILIPFNRPDKGDCNENENEKEFDSLFRKLENLQGRLGRARTEHERVQRCKALVDTLKRVYRYRCQLCSEENGLIPLIENNDEYYVEMHHIKYIGESDNLADDWQSLDYYQNALIVCSQHHRFLHYHHGGFKRHL